MTKKYYLTELSNQYGSPYGREILCCERGCSRHDGEEISSETAEEIWENRVTNDVWDQTHWGYCKNTDHAEAEISKAAFLRLCKNAGYAD